MFLEVGEYISIAIGFFITISNNYESLILSEATLLFLCFTCCTLLTYISQEFSNPYLYRNGDAGVMYSFLFPIIHMLLNFKASNENNQTLNFFHIGCILFSFLPAILELLRYKITADALNGFSYVASLSYILMFAYWFVLLLHKLDLLSFIFISFLLCVHTYFLLSIPTWLPGSFTFGELVVLCQSFSFFLFQAIATFLSIKVHSGIRMVNQYVTDYDMTTFIYVLVSSTILFLLLLSHIPWLRTHWCKFYFLLSFIITFFSVPLLLAWMRQNVVVWLVEFVFQSKHSIVLLSFWTFSCCIAVAIVIYANNNNDDHNNNNNLNNEPCNPFDNLNSIRRNVRNNNSNNNNTNTNNNNNNGFIISDDDINDNIEMENSRLRTSRVRKVFHVLVAMVFIPSYYLNDQLLCLATVVALVLFVMLEAVRLLDIPPLGGPMRKHLSVFLDQQDSGLVILTPIYLLIGCSAPLWISIGRKVSSLLVFVGVISIGVGDTVASLVGTKFGRVHWKDSKKTIEGTVSSIIAQIIITYAILCFDKTNDISHMRIVASVIMTSLIEAFTIHIDNLVLPLFMYFVLV